jgi:hypothetical protein
MAGASTTRLSHMTHKETTMQRLFYATLTAVLLAGLAFAVPRVQVGRAQAVARIDSGQGTA